ncbi:hypothetical protein J6590_082925 [Homalodisca vitripennis]|nr:hypothetical protein J6590_082925 [Homalodisca vitripennis]
MAGDDDHILQMLNDSMRSSEYDSDTVLEVFDDNTDEDPDFVCGNSVNLTDDLKFRCGKIVALQKKARKKCGWRVSAKVGTFLERSKVNINTLWRFIVTYLFTSPPRHSFVKTHLHLTDPTIVDYYSFIREVYIDHLKRNSQQLSGPGAVVEIDEAKFGKESTTEDG